MGMKVISDLFLWLTLSPQITVPLKVNLGEKALFYSVEQTDICILNLIKCKLKKGPINEKLH